MSLPHFRYHEPVSLTEACKMLEMFGEKAVLLAGGTDLLVKMRNRQCQPENVISIAELKEINQISLVDNHLSVGAGCTVTQIAESEAIRATFPAIVSGANHLASPTIRNTATIAGNIMTASPAADLPPALMAYGAKVLMKKMDEERFVPLERFFCSPGVTQSEENEILTEIHIEKPPEFSGAGFFKLGNRKALQISIINGACYFALNPQSGNIETARIVLGAVAPIPIRAYSAENILKDQKPGMDLFREAGSAAAGDCSPINDLRGSIEYRKDMVEMLTQRTLVSIYEQISKLSRRT